MHKAQGLTLSSFIIMSSSSSSCSEQHEQQEQQLLFTLKEESLRRFLKEKPKNARKMSELALLLGEKASASASALQQNNNNNNNNISIHNNKEEALDWAQRAIQVAPTKPYGYAALSSVLLLLQQQDNNNNNQQYDRRIQALQSAIQYIAAPTIATATATTTLPITTPSSITRALWVTRIVLLVRLLLEPRIQEALTKVPDGSARNHLLRVANQSSAALHPSQRQLDALENALYQKIQADLSFLSSPISSSSSSSLEHTQASCVFLTGKQHETLAMHCDYRLGLFFRKKLPAQVYRSLARFHFQRAVQRLETLFLLPLRHPKLGNAQFWLATMTAATTTTTTANNDDDNYTVVVPIMDRCPRDYVIGLYSTFAERFDDLLVNKLDYQTPTLLQQLVQQAIQVNNGDCTRNDATATTRCQHYYFHKAVDLGCGTGLSGMAFRHLIAPGRGSLTGIDLSPEMIAKAKQRTCPRPCLVDDPSTSGGAQQQQQQQFSCYDVLLVGDLELALDLDNDDVGNEADDNLYSLVFACDVFCYIGDLKQIFQRVYNALTNRGGIFAFSVELLQPLQQQNSRRTPCTSNNMVPFQLHECARFAHSQDYLNELARDCGFNILQTQTCPIRKNQGESVMGLLYVLESGQRLVSIRQEEY